MLARPLVNSHPCSCSRAGLLESTIPVDAAGVLAACVSVLPFWPGLGLACQGCLASSACAAQYLLGPLRRCRKVEYQTARHIVNCMVSSALGERRPDEQRTDRLEALALKMQLALSMPAWHMSTVGHSTMPVEEVLHTLLQEKLFACRHARGSWRSGIEQARSQRHSNCQGGEALRASAATPPRDEGLPAHTLS